MIDERKNRARSEKSTQRARSISRQGHSQTRPRSTPTRRPSNSSGRSSSSRRYTPEPQRKWFPLVPIVILAALCAIGLGNFFLNPFEKTLELKGSTEQSLMVGSVYEEAGTSLNAEEVQIDGFVDTQQAGTYTLSYAHGSQKLERIVHVLNDRQIVMNLNGSRVTYVKQGQPYIESGCHVIDKAEGDLSSLVEISGSVDPSAPGMYEVTYKVANNSGVTCSRVREVHVVPESEFVAATEGVPVFMYHYVHTAENPPVDDPYPNNFILDTDLDAQLNYLSENDFYYPSFQELSAYIDGTIDLPQKSVMLTFDDGERGFLEHGIPLFEKYRIPATSFIITSDSDAADKVKTYASEYISFQSHTYAMHQGGGSEGHGGIISALTKEEILSDLITAQSIVQNTEALAYPFGDHTATAHEAVREAGILCAFTTEYGRVYQGADPTCLPRVRILGETTLEGFMYLTS